MAQSTEHSATRQRPLFPVINKIAISALRERLTLRRFDRWESNDRRNNTAHLRLAGKESRVALGIHAAEPIPASLAYMLQGGFLMIRQQDVVQPAQLNFKGDDI